MNEEEFTFGSSHRHRTAQDMVAEGLRRAILGGSLESGQPLRQEQIARDFEVSAVPVREALRQLAGEGLVTLSPNRGARVSEVSYEEAREISEIRIALESLALKLAVPNMSEDDFQQAERVLELWDAEEDPATFTELNWRFHTVLFEPAHQPRLMAMIRSLHASFDLYAGSYSAAWMDLKVVAQEQHRNIVEACRRGDTKDAIAILERHIRDGFSKIARHMREQGVGEAEERRDGKAGRN